MPETLALVGYGAMGSRMGRRLLAAGYPLRVYDVASAARAQARQDGADTAERLTEVVRGCSLVITMLPDGATVEAVALGPDGIAHAAGPGTLLLEMSSSYPPTTRKVHAALGERGILMMDAPVSGGTVGAEAGTLTIMVGGEEAHLDRARPVLAVLGKTIVHVGGIGAGHTIKALNNLLSATTLAATAEAMTLAVRSGIAPERALDVFSTSTGRSYSAEYKFPRFVLPGTFNAGFALGLLKKDVEIAVRLGREADHPLLLGNLVRELVGLAVGQLGPNVDHTELVRLIEGWAKVEVRASGRAATEEEARAPQPE
ncbi:MAG: NAD(P)-dependent oxidoreductase [Chloroflexi bacterium]|nr:NAD(P)-dependent oxidoreductase [Chloroflexota bacterium]